MIELVGLLPSNTLDFKSAWLDACAPNSCSTCIRLSCKHGETVHAHLGDLLFRFTERQSLWLRKEVAEQDFMVHTTSDGVLGLDRSEEISWDELGALVNELVKGVLAVRSRCTPEDGL